METNRNFFLTIGISVAILVLWQVFYVNPRIDSERAKAEIEANQPGNPAQPGTPAQPGEAAPANPALPGEQPGDVAATDRAAALATTARVPLDTPSLSGSINLRGGRIDDLRLKRYQLTVDASSDTIEFLSPSNWRPKSSGHPDHDQPPSTFVETGFIGTDATGKVPQADTVWTVEGTPTLTPSTPVTLTWVNDKGLTFKRTISVDDNYMFTVSDAVTNGGGASVQLQNYGRVTRFDKPKTASIWVLHEGLIGVTGQEGLQEVDYSDVEDSKRVTPGKSTDGWLGLTDKYWAAALIPSKAQPFQPEFGYADDAAGGGPRYRSSFLTDPITVAAGATTTVETQIFAGAKEVAKVNGYRDDRNIRQFDLLIDWGWFYFITKPMFWLIDNLFKLLGNFGLAILATTVIVKAIFFPLANKSYKSMANMKKVQPKLLEIREKYSDDKVKQQQAMMELYRTEKINPLAGCWPILIQIPVFFALYKVLYVTIEMRHAPFFGWIQDLAAPDPTSLFNLFGLLPYDVPHLLMIGVWPLIMGITMFLQMRMNPTPPDPTQAMIFNWMPLVFTFMLASFPAGLVIYWAWNNALSITQQALIMKRQGAKIELWDNLGGLF
ncbi:MAG: membrane protein insertase YidC, partial [Rhizobiaceae bacterium]